MNESEDKHDVTGMRFGIDLGTTYSSIGWYNPDTNQVEIADLVSAQGRQGEKLLPSAVFIESPDNIVVGNTAIHAGMSKGERLSQWFKRDLGNPPDAYPILDGKRWTPLECSTEVLKALKREGEIFFHTEIKDVVITFPAWFNPQQKGLTREAAIMAGLNVINMIEEPVAAALAYIIDEVLRQADKEASKVTNLSSAVPQIIEKLAGKGTQPGESKAVLVFDLGGGTFDVALVQAWGEPMPDGNTALHTKVLYNEGDILLGGKDWDARLKDLLADLDMEKNGHNPKEDLQSVLLDEYCEGWKRDLSKVTKITATCPSHHVIEITREMLKARTEDKLQRTRQIIENVLALAETEYGIPKKNITLLLSGGMCKWPPVVEMLTEVMDGRAPTVHKNLDFMVTYGAAYLAHVTVVAEEREKVVKGKGTPTPPEIEGVSPTPSESEEASSNLPMRGHANKGLIIVPPEVPYPAIGIEVLDKSAPMTPKTKVSKIIPTDSIRGEYYEEKYANAFDNQTEVKIELYFLKEREGHKDNETDLAAWNKYQTFSMTGLPPKPEGQLSIHVELKYAEGGVILGRAFDDFHNEIKIEGKTFEG